MSYLVRIFDTPFEFRAEAGQSLLDAAEKHGLNVPWACRSGACGACKAELLSGEVDLGKFVPSALPEADIKAGKILMCKATAKSDLEIKVRSVKKIEPKQAESIEVKIVEKNLLAPSILRLVLKRTDDKAFSFKAGQTYRVELPGGAFRYYSIANSELQQETIEFLIRRVTGGLSTGLLFSDELRVGDKMRLKGPEGDMTFKTPRGKKAIFLATGTGIAAVKSIVQTLVEKDDLKGRSLHIFWGVRNSEDLVCGSLFESWAAHHPEITFTPVVSREPEWRGATGHVQKVAAELHGDMTEVDAYICGSSSLINSAMNFLTVRCGLKEDHIYTDNFGG